MKSIKTRNQILKAGMLTIALLLSASAGHAADLCFKDQFGDIVVFKRAKTPRPGDCQPLHGYQHGAYCTFYGSACGSTDGKTIRYGFDYVCSNPMLGSNAWDLERGSDRGVGTSCGASIDGGGWGCPTFTFHRIECPKPAYFP